MCIELSRFVIIVHQFDFDHINRVIRRLQNVLVKLQEN